MPRPPVSRSTNPTPEAPRAHDRHAARPLDPVHAPPPPQLRDRTPIDVRRTPDHRDQPGGPGHEAALAVVTEELCRATAARTGLAGTVVTVMSPSGAPAVLAASDDWSRACQELQFSTGEGPTHDAHATGHPVLVPDLPGEAGRWPAYVGAAVEAGVHAVFTFPLQLGAVRIGVLSGYSEHPRSLSAADLVVLLDRAGEVTERLLDGTGRDPAAAGRDVADAVHLRNEVYQAQGIVAEQLGVGLAEALARIRVHAFAGGLDLDALAIDIVAGRVRLPDDRPPAPDHHPRRPETEAS